MWELTDAKSLPDGLNLRGKTYEEINDGWVNLPGFGRKEILVRTGVRGNLHVDECMHEYIVNLNGLLTLEELQKVVDILARHGEISGLHYAREFNTVGAKKEVA